MHHLHACGKRHAGRGAWGRCASILYVARVVWLVPLLAWESACTAAESRFHGGAVSLFPCCAGHPSGQPCRVAAYIPAVEGSYSNGPAPTAQGPCVQGMVLCTAVFSVHVRSGPEGFPCIPDFVRSTCGGGWVGARVFFSGGLLGTGIRAVCMGAHLEFLCLCCQPGGDCRAGLWLRAHLGTTIYSGHPRRVAWYAPCSQLPSPVCCLLHALASFLCRLGGVSGERPLGCVEGCRGIRPCIWCALQAGCKEACVMRILGGTCRDRAAVCTALCWAALLPALPLLRCVVELPSEGWCACTCACVCMLGLLRPPLCCRYGVVLGMRQSEAGECVRCVCVMCVCVCMCSSALAGPSRPSHCASTLLKGFSGLAAWDHHSGVKPAHALG
jgi:hypothetical protein